MIGRLPAPLVCRLGNIRQAALAQGAVGGRDGGGCGVRRARRIECRLIEIGGRRNGDDAVVRREAFGKQMEVDLGSRCTASVPLAWPPLTLALLVATRLLSSPKHKNGPDRSLKQPQSARSPARPPARWLSRTFDDPRSPGGDVFDQHVAPPEADVAKQRRIVGLRQRRHSHFAGAVAARLQQLDLVARDVSDPEPSSRRPSSDCSLKKRAREIPAARLRLCIVECLRQLR